MGLDTEKGLLPLAVIWCACACVCGGEAPFVWGSESPRGTEEDGGRGPEMDGRPLEKRPPPCVAGRPVVAVAPEGGAGWALCMSMEELLWGSD